jgi:hypothetical protein
LVQVENLRTAAMCAQRSWFAWTVHRPQARTDRFRYVADFNGARRRHLRFVVSVLRPAARAVTALERVASSAWMDEGSNPISGAPLARAYPGQRASP